MDKYPGMNLMDRRGIPSKEIPLSSTHTLPSKAQSRRELTRKYMQHLRDQGRDISEIIGGKMFMIAYLYLFDRYTLAELGRQYGVSDMCIRNWLFADRNSVYSKLKRYYRSE
jgi:hypothetical protein